MYTARTYYNHGIWHYFQIRSDNGADTGGILRGFNDRKNNERGSRRVWNDVVKLGNPGRCRKKNWSRANWQGAVHGRVFANW